MDSGTSRRTGSAAAGSAATGTKRSRKSGKPNDLRQLRRSLIERGVKYLFSSYVDLHGVPKGKLVPIDHLEQMMAGSELYTGAALEGVPQDVSEEEVSSHPDPASCLVLPWQPDTAWFASNLWCRGKPFDACSRTILAKQMERAAKLGYVPQLGMEAEFFVLQDDGNGGYGPLTNDQGILLQAVPDRRRQPSHAEP